MKHFPILTTERLLLRQLSNSDLQEIFLLRSDPIINTFLNRKPCNTLKDATNFIETIKNNSLTYWAITQKGNDQLIGTICLFEVSKTLKTCEIGYELLTAFQGKGFMKEAAKKVIEYAFVTLKLNVINAYTHAENQSSTLLLKALKFKSAYGVVHGINSKLVLFRLDT